MALQQVGEELLSDPTLLACPVMQKLIADSRKLYGSVAPIGLAQSSSLQGLWICAAAQVADAARLAK